MADSGHRFEYLAGIFCNLSASFVAAPHDCWCRRDQQLPFHKAAAFNYTTEDTSSGDRCALQTGLERQRTRPRSSVYLNMRRRKSTDDITEAIRKALLREKDGVLEPPPGSDINIFLDDVHLVEEVSMRAHYWLITPCAIAPNVQYC